MIIAGYSPPHDGCFAVIENNKLILSKEGEKDSHERFSGIPEDVLKNLLSKFKPDIFCRSDSYFGLDRKNIDNSFFSTHERAHIMSAYAMSPFEQGEECYALCWEGVIGSFYYIDKNLKITKLQEVMKYPGSLYQLIYGIALKNKPQSRNEWNSFPGKIMALTSFADKTSNYQDISRELLEYGIHNHHGDDDSYETSLVVKKFNQSLIYNVGVENQVFKNFSFYYSEEIFNKFYQFSKNLNKKIPLLITGGCGLNCDWNTKWKEIFSKVFVSPVSNDSGQAIGLAVDAQQYFFNQAKIEWTVYSGESFIHDIPSIGFNEFPLNLKDLARILYKEEIIPWIQGNYEIGPRALGHRSLFASPFKKEMHDRLNSIKKREMFRPIAPICTLEDVNKFFEWNEESPYMLHFMNVKDENIQAVTHVDKTARTQTISKTQDNITYSLLKEFERISDYPILCNTSLNFSGKGFINRMSDLILFMNQSKLNIFVVDNKMYIRKNYGIN